MKRQFYRFGFLLPSFVMLSLAAEQTAQSKPEQPAPSPVVDRLGRSTPRGAVLGFLNAASKSDYKVAVQYLHTRLRNDAASLLAQQLYVVLDRRLPARLTLLSDKPEGTLSYLEDQNLELVGSINTANGGVEITLERVELPKGGLGWLFSNKTLDAVPALYAEVQNVPVESYVPAFLRKPHILGVALFEWLAIILGLPIVYFAIAVVHRLISRSAGLLQRRLRRRPDLVDPQLLPGPFRLFVIAILIRWMLSKITLPLLARQLWSGVEAIIVIGACAWLLTKVVGWSEQTARRRLTRAGLYGATPLVGFARRAANLLIIFLGIIAALRYFGVNLAAALTGLGIGGIAIALAAQKTLENIIGGLSIIFDRTISVGEALKVSGTEGTVIEIGLRSTRIRTPNRSIVSVPNGQIATASLENVSACDKFKFHHIVGLRCDTTVAQMRAVLEEVNRLLVQRPATDKDSVRARFIRLGTSSLDVEVFAYIVTRDSSDFLLQQQELLLDIMNAIERVGAAIAIPSQTLVVRGTREQLRRGAAV